MKNAKNVTAMTGAIVAMILLVTVVPTNAYAEYLANSQTVTGYKNTVITGYMTGSAPQEFFYQVKVIPKNGSLEYNGATGQFWYTPNKDFTGSDSFTFRTVAVKNTKWFGQQALVTINVVASPSSTTSPSSSTSGDGNRMYEFAWKIANNLNGMNNVVPDSGMQFWQLNGVMNGVLYTSMMGADFANIGWNNLSEGQQVWIILHWEQLIQ